MISTLITQPMQGVAALAMSALAPFAHQPTEYQAPTAPKQYSLSKSQLFSLSASISGFAGSQLDSDGFAAEQARSKAAAQELAAKWKRLVLTPEASSDADALTETVDPLFEALARFGAGAIDLRDLPVERINGIHLAVVLRATLSVRALTLGWDEALGVARLALQRDGHIPEDALIGLI